MSDKPTVDESYIGPNKLLGATILDYKTPKGNDVVKIMYENTNIPHEIMPKSTFESVVTKEPKDWNFVRERRSLTLLNEITELCMEHDVVYGDIDNLAGNIREKLKAAFDRATNYLWTGDDKQFIPGNSSPINLRSLLEADQVLKKIKSDGGDKPGEK